MLSGFGLCLDPVPNVFAAFSIRGYAEDPRVNVEVGRLAQQLER